jgi:ribonuclease VapC
MVVDTSALVGFLLDEPEADPIRDAMAAADRRFISALTLFECRTVLWARFGAEMVQGLHDLLDGWQPIVRAFDAEQAGLAFAAYRKFGKGTGHKAQLNLCDCAAYALARSLDLPLLFKGDDFDHTDVRSALA